MRRWHLTHATKMCDANSRISRAIQLFNGDTSAAARAHARTHARTHTHTHLTFADHNAIESLTSLTHHLYSRSHVDPYRTRALEWLHQVPEIKYTGAQLWRKLPPATAVDMISFSKRLSDYNYTRHLIRAQAMAILSTIKPFV